MPWLNTVQYALDWTPGWMDPQMISRLAWMTVKRTGLSGLTPCSARLSLSCL